MNYFERTTRARRSAFSLPKNEPTEAIGAISEQRFEHSNVPDYGEVLVLLNPRQIERTLNTDHNTGNYSGGP
jgi:hypothetical protein